MAIILLMSLISLVSSRYWSCPETCTCVRRALNGNDGNLSTVVSCVEGGLDERSFARLMSVIPENVSILEIIGPKDRPNRFTITQDFERFRSLAELHLINCGLTSLGKRTFENVKSLRILNLSGNRIEVLSPDVFTNTEHLLELNLSRNFLRKTILPTGAFAHLKNLEILDLSDNNIEYFTTTNLFGGLSNLKTLKLGKNRMNELSFDVLKDLPNLELLSLDNCQLNNIPEIAFEKNPKLKKLVLSYNKLRSTYLSASRNVPHLESLDLSSNLITSVSDSTFRYLEKLRKLILSNNYIGATMNDKYMGSKGIVRQPVVLHPLGGNLEELDLSNNSLFDFKTVYIEPFGQNLKLLRLSSNKLFNITPDQTLNLKYLRELYLSDVQLTFLPDKLPTEYANLKLLDLSNNQISKLSVDHSNFLSKLSSLNLAGNNFSKLYDYHRYFLAKLDYSNLDNNPWDCQNCRTLINLQSLLENDRFTQDQINCGSPEELVGKPVRTIVKLNYCPKIFGAISELSPQSEFGLLIGGVCALLLILALTTAVVCCYFWNRPRLISSAGNNYSTPQNAEETLTLSSASSENNSHHSEQPSLKDLTSSRRNS